MCRIAGIISLDNADRSIFTHVKAMCNSLQHGGPDDEGIYLTENSKVCLGHRRLSLLDLSPLGHQPMADPDQKCWLVFNGEIYNFKELKAELQVKGYHFKSTSDTEVILAAYLEWGTASFKRFNGMFAFALYDVARSSVYLVRDAAGIKPLYYHTNVKGQLTFASEVKAFKALNKDWEENPDWRLLMLCFGHIPEPYTTLKEVYALPKGTFLCYNLNSGQIKNEKFRELGFTSARITSRDEAIFEIKSKLDTAVERHLISDAPIGLFLSGGIDSSLLSLIAADKVKEQLHTLSVTFAEDQFSEKEYQEAIINKINCKHDYCFVSKQDLEIHLNDIISAYDQPSNDGINSWFISRCAHQVGLKAVLSGLGSDEVFGGYPSFKRMDNLYKIKNFPGALLDLSKYIPSIPLQRISWLQIKKPVGIYLTLRGLCTPSEAGKLCGISAEEVIRKIDTLNFSPTQASEIQQDEAASWLEFNMYMQNQLLKDSDYMSMQHALELRVPFLDQEFLDTVFSIDTRLLYKHQGLPKQLLIDAFRDLMPEKIWNRKKMGFSFPFQKWFGAIEQLRAGISHTPAGKNLMINFDAGKTHWSKLWAYYLSQNFKG